MFIAAICLLSACHKDESAVAEKIITLQPSATDGKDAAIFNCVACGYDIRNFGTIVEMDALATTNNYQISNVRSLIYFDLSTISPNATIVSAKLSLYAYNSPANGAHSVLSGSNASFLQRVTSTWDESTVTWDTQPTTTDVNQVLLPESTNNTEDYTDIDITTLLKDIIKNPSQNFGLMLKLQSEIAYRGLVFASSDNADATKHPKLVVDYKQ